MIQLILLALVASALVGAMFWDPKMGDCFARSKAEQELDSITHSWLDGHTIKIDLEKLDLDEVRNLSTLYVSTPIGYMIRDYGWALEKRLEEEATKAKRVKYISELEPKGYSPQQLEPLKTQTLERMLEDLD